MKNKKLNTWLWKWHFIAGIISLPFVLLLSITGAIYLFKDKVENPVKNNLKQVTVTNAKISYQQQLQIVTETIGKKPDGLVISTDENEATEFIKGKFGHKKSIYINPYTKKVIGTFTPKDTWMQKVRKLHGELLGGKVGTKIIELVASWMVVLILSGIYIFWPKNNNLKSFFTIRFQKGKRTLYKDIHAVFGFWISILLLLVLAGGFPWTDVFGGNFKNIQFLTNTGFPMEWFGKGIRSTVKETPLTLNEMVAIAKQQNLEGVVTLTLPKNKKAPFSIHNQTFPLKNQKKIHFDQYSGNILKTLNWSDVGILMRARMWVMAFHQGQFGKWNFWLMFSISVLLTIISVAGLISYLKRKKPNSLGIPSVPKDFKIGYGVLTLIIALGIIFPLFGLSLLLILFSSYLKKLKGT